MHYSVGRRDSGFGIRDSFGTRIAAMKNQPRASFQSPRFAQPATFMRLPHVEDPRGLDVAIVGVPYDGGTSYRPGARLGPYAILTSRNNRWGTR